MPGKRVQFAATVAPEMVAEIDRLIETISTKVGFRVRQSDFLALAVAALSEKHPPTEPVPTPTVPLSKPVRRRGV